MSNPKSQKRVLAVYPNSRGFGFAALEGTAWLVDWGVVYIKANKHDGCLGRIGRLISRYEPEIIVTEDPADCPHRTAKIRALLQGIRDLASSRRAKWKGFSRTAVRKTFHRSVKVTKYQIAEGIAGRFPELEVRLPRPRKPWMSEDARMAIFDAVALALTYFA